jgi:acetyl-CoA acetyltransferase
MAVGALNGQLTIVGVGTTAQGELPGCSANEIAVDAFRLALHDAGIDKQAINGLITCKSYGGQGIDTQIGALAGLNPRYSATLEYGTCNFSLHLAAMVLASGMATTVALVYGTNQRTARNRFAGVADSGEDALFAPYGFLNIAGPAALSFKRHQYLYGTTEQQLAHVAIAERKHAQLNPLAVFKLPLSMDDYFAARYIVRPLRRPDLCMISDGGACLIVTSRERAVEFARPPVYLLAGAQQTGLRHFQNVDNLLRPWARALRESLYEQAGLNRSDVDALYVQDATSVAVLDALETYGFCGEGESGPFVEDGRIELGGALPVNTNGGQLSESYMWGWLHLCEAVRQLRGECGPRQVVDARFAQYCSTQGYRKVASSILGNVLV